MERAMGNRQVKSTRDSELRPSFSPACSVLSTHCFNAPF